MKVFLISKRFVTVRLMGGTEISMKAYYRKRVKKINKKEYIHLPKFDLHFFFLNQPER